MCIAAVIFSLIPILSGYAVYLAFSTVITKGSPALQWTVSLLLAAVLVWALVWAAQRIRRRAIAQRAVDAGVVDARVADASVVDAEDERADAPPPPHRPDGLPGPARDPAHPQATGH